MFQQARLTLTAEEDARLAEKIKTAKKHLTALSGFHALTAHAKGQLEKKI
jgi:hypothetical protein